MLEVFWHNAASASQHESVTVLELNDPTALELRCICVGIVKLVEVQWSPEAKN